jgi:fructose-1-phosphate kinase PfkB-like protein
MLWALSNNSDLHHALSIATATAAAALQTQGKLRFDVTAIKTRSQQVVVTSLN